MHNKNTPNEIKKWNWGAFFLTFIWGIPHRVYFSLLIFIPIVGIVVPFILGAKGNDWAWKKGRWRDTEEFLKSQKAWELGGLIFFIIILIPFIIGLLNILYNYN